MLNVGWCSRRRKYPAATPGFPPHFNIGTLVGAAEEENTRRQHRVFPRISTLRISGDVYCRSPPEAQDEVQRVSLFQLKIAELLVSAAELLPAEDYALLLRGDSLSSLVFGASSAGGLVCVAGDAGGRSVGTSSSRRPRFFG